MNPKDQQTAPEPARGATTIVAGVERPVPPLKGMRATRVLNAAAHALGQLPQLMELASTFAGNYKANTSKEVRPEMLFAYLSGPAWSMVAPILPSVTAALRFSEEDAREDGDDSAAYFDMVEHVSEEASLGEQLHNLATCIEVIYPEIANLDMQRIGDLGKTLAARAKV